MTGFVGLMVFKEALGEPCRWRPDSTGQFRVETKSRTGTVTETSRLLKDPEATRRPVVIMGNGLL